LADTCTLEGYTAAREAGLSAYRYGSAYGLQRWLCAAGADGSGAVDGLFTTCNN